MGLYYLTYLYKGKLVKNDDCIDIDKQNTFSAANASIQFLPGHFFKLGNFDPIIEQNDKTRGYVSFEDLKHVVRSKTDIAKVLNEPNDWCLCEMESCTLDNPSNLYITCNLPVLSKVFTKTEESRYNGKHTITVLSDGRFSLIMTNVIYYRILTNPTSGKIEAVDPNGGPFFGIGYSFGPWKISSFDQVRDEDDPNEVDPIDDAHEKIVYVEGCCVKHASPNLSRDRGRLASTPTMENSHVSFGS